ncbi:hypothetical protein NDN08_007279 [Rhodosorus marinus]|uniref:Peptidase M14 domain-containing protein n=1 Tax=Rhodosorus marinus TaxID=101924 RepID=A0AAV8UK38_9RHOD|nr:hypothetical protein NDN08_007279 [Rhodosorus marinus]
MGRGRMSIAGLLLLIIVFLFAEWTSGAPSRERYRYLSYAEINGGMKFLAARYSDIIRVYSANKEHNIPSPGLCRGDHTQKQTVPCEVQIAELGVRPIDRSRAQVIIIGSIHGDERLGAQIAFHLIKLLAVKYKQDPWIQRLLSTRRIVVVPMPNPSGYDRSMRYEEVEGELVDPNTDFPIDQSNPSNCMKSTTARIINELFQSSLFRIAVIFHSKKTPSIGYSWGSEGRCTEHAMNATDHPSWASGRSICTAGYDTPDELAMRLLAQHMSTFAGDFGGDSYKVGSLNDPELDSSFPTTMVDWAYAGSFTDNMTNCKPSTHGGYPLEYTTYNDVSNRCVSYSVETSRESSPAEKDLGEPRGLYARKESNGNGHIPRNLRLALMAIDVANPYIFFLNSPGAKVDLTRGGVLRLKWSIGGAFEVAETFIEFEIESTKEKFTTKVQSGGSMWAQNYGRDGYEKRFDVIQGINLMFSGSSSTKWAYSETIRILKYIPLEVQKTGSDMLVRAVAKVDYSWANVTEQTVMASNGSEVVVKSFGAESHLARSRADPHWLKRSLGYEVRGDEFIYSDVVRMRLPPKTLRNSLYGYVLELVLCALIVCFVPPLVLVMVWRKVPAANYVQRNMRRAMRTFSKKDIADEAARLREQKRTTSKVDVSRALLG